MENGEEYAIKAIIGQVILSLKPDTDMEYVKKCISSAGGEIIKNITDEHDLLIKTKSGDECRFMEQIQQFDFVKAIIPNFILVPYDARLHIVDDFDYNDLYSYKTQSSPHGEIVRYSAIVSGTSANNIELSTLEKKSSASLKEKLSQLIKEAPNDEPVIINLSLGPK